MTIFILEWLRGSSELKNMNTFAFIHISSTSLISCSSTNINPSVRTYTNYFYISHFYFCNEYSNTLRALNILFLYKRNDCFMIS